jgi:hypothetical protein
MSESYKSSTSENCKYMRVCVGGYSAGYIPRYPKWQWLEPTLRRLHRKEKIALSALADTMDKAEKWRRMQRCRQYKPTLNASRHQAAHSKEYQDRQGE